MSFKKIHRSPTCQCILKLRSLFGLGDLVRYVALMYRIAASVLLVICILGCSGKTGQLTEPDEQNRLATHINSLLVANHDHFVRGRPLERSLNSDAFDFMVGKKRSDFPVLFGNSSSTVSINDASLQYPNLKISEWMADTQQRYEDRLRFDVFLTNIGRTVGINEQADYLVVAQSNDVIVDWHLFAITDY